METLLKTLLKTLFRKGAARSRSQAELALASWGIRYNSRPDGTLFVPGDLDISYKGLTRLPDLSSVSVGRNFTCSKNHLTTLEGAPQFVGGDFSCYKNHLTTLEGAPQTVGGGFSCRDNQLTSLERAPQSVGGDFYCDNNQLTSLEHAPQTVGGGFFCYKNQLTSLKGAPRTVGGNFNCANNQLTSLEGAPQTFQKLRSDLGEFASCADVPEELRFSPEARARMEQERQQEAFTDGATVLQSSLRVQRPLKLKSDPLQRG